MSELLREARRFRVFDWSTQWFWLVILWEDGRLNVGRYRSAHGRWFHALKWELAPGRRGGEVPPPFIAALKPDVTIEGVGESGALPVSSGIALRNWWDRRRRG